MPNIFDAKPKYYYTHSSLCNRGNPIMLVRNAEVSGGRQGRIPRFQLTGAGPSDHIKYSICSGGAGHRILRAHNLPRVWDMSISARLEGKSEARVEEVRSQSASQACGAQIGIGGCLMLQNVHEWMKDE